MHELPVMKSVLDICLKHATANDARRIVSIILKVGEMSDLQDEWMQRYFDYLSNGTLAEGAKLIIERVPVVMRCKQCSESFAVNIREEKQIECPRCKGRELAYISGREYRVESIGVD